MTCKDCIHYDVCSGFTPTDLDRDVFDYCREGRTDEIPDIEERCSGFKDSNRLIELPYKVGTKVYIAYEEHINQVFDGALVSYSLDSAHLWFNCHYTCGLNMWHPIEDFGKNVFLTKEDAEKALKERSEGK